MSAIVDRFIRQLKARGLSVSGPKDGDPPDRLYLNGPTAEKTPPVMQALAKFKPALVELFGRKADATPGPAPSSPDQVIGSGGDLMLVEAKEGESRPR